MFDKNRKTAVAGGFRTFAIMMLLLYPVAAHAYLDAGTGSVILQAVIATLAAAAFGIRVYWQKLKSRLGRKPPESNDSKPTT